MTERKLDEFLNQLDETCSFILAELIQNPKGIGFNELYRNMRKHSECKTLAKSTLSDHIIHLINDNFIGKEEIKESPLKIKPVRYKTSRYFRELSIGLIAQSTTPEDFLLLMRAEDVQAVTDHLKAGILIHTAKCLKAMLQAPENISRWNMHQALYMLETLMTAYRERIIESKDEETALNALDKWIPNH